MASRRIVTLPVLIGGPGDGETAPPDWPELTHYRYPVFRDGGSWHDALYQRELLAGPHGAVPGVHAWVYGDGSREDQVRQIWAWLVNAAIPPDA